MCRYVESIRLFEGKMSHLDYHQKRLDRTLRLTYPGALISLKDIDIPGNCGSGLYKVRVVYGQSIEKIEFLPYKPRKIKALRKVKGDTVEYRFKSVDRSCIHGLRPGDLGDDEDYLIIKHSCVSDVSSSTVAFQDGDSWYVPDTPLLPGTTRERLLEEGVVCEARIMEADIPDFTKVCVFNAMINFGTIVLSVSDIR